MFEWSEQTWDTLATIVMAGATVVTAGATVVLAILSRGTWKLYDLEKRRYTRQVARKAARVVREAREIRQAAAQIGGEVPQDPGSWYQARQSFSKREAWLESKEVAVREIYDTAADFPGTAMAHMDVALTNLWWGRHVLEDWQRAAEAEDQNEFNQSRQTFKEALQAASGALRSAYDAIPRKLKIWGEETQPYEELLDVAAAQNRSEYPQQEIEEGE